MELRQINYFIELARTLNFSRAAEQLYISQPTLSQQIALLEEELGAQLFHRNHHSTTLTRSGQIFLDYCIRITALLGEAQEKVRLSVQESVNLTFTIGIDESVSILDKQGFFNAIATFRENFSDCKLLLRVLPFLALRSALERGEIDVAISIVMIDELESMICEHKIFGRQKILLCVPKQFKPEKPERLLQEAAEKLDLCLLSTDQHWADNFRHLYQRTNLPFHPTYVNSYGSCCTYVQAGFGAMIDTEYAMTAEREQFSNPIFFPGPHAQALDVLLWNPDNNHRLLPTFLDLFSEKP